MYKHNKINYKIIFFLIIADVIVFSKLDLILFSLCEYRKPDKNKINPKIYVNMSTINLHNFFLNYNYLLAFLEMVA